MPYYRRRSSLPYRCWRRNFYRRPSTLRSQVSGRRTFNVSVPVENVLSVTVAANASWSNAITTCPLMADLPGTSIRHGVSLLHSLLYRTYTKLYDQVKINSVRLTFDLISPIGQGGLAPAIKVYTSWDRCYDSEDAHGSVPAGSTLVNGSEAQCQMFVNNSRAGFTRYNKCSDLQERSVYHDCSYTTVTEGGVNYYEDSAWARDCSFYCPSCILCVQTGDAVVTDRVFPVSIRAVYNVTFRNPKYGLSAAPTKGGEDVESLVKELEMQSSGKKMNEGESDVSEGFVLSKKVKFEEPVYEESVIPDDESVGMDDESSQPELTKEELLEMLKKFEEKKS